MFYLAKNFPTRAVRFSSYEIKDKLKEGGWGGDGGEHLLRNV